MNRKMIEKAARRKLKGIVPCEWNQQPFIDIFVIAAKWRINAVWHDSSEEPEREDEPILVEYEDWGADGSDYTVCDDIWDYNSRLKRNGGYCTILRWAYVSDLLPDKKEAQP